MKKEKFEVGEIIIDNVGAVDSFSDSLKKIVNAKVNNEMLEKVRVVAWNKLIRREIIQDANIQFPNQLPIPKDSKIPYYPRFQSHNTSHRNKIHHNCLWQGK